MRKARICLRWYFGIIGMLFTFASHAQNSDSLLQIMRSSQDVHVRIEAAQRFLSPFQNQSVDSIVYSANQLIQIGKERHFIDLEAMGVTYYGLMHRVKGETYEALSYYIKAFKLAEKAPDNLLFAWIYIAYGNLYNALNNPDKSLSYYKKGLFYLETENSYVAGKFKRILLGNIASLFNQKHRYDSALVYLQKSMEIALFSKDSLTTTSNSILGNTYLGLGEPDLAYVYYRRNLELAMKRHLERSIRSAHVLLGNYFKAIGNNDSAIAYYSKAFANSNIISGPDWSVEPALALYEIYKARGNDKVALAYLELHRNAKMKVDSLAQVQQLQSLSFEEDMRQREREEELLKEKEERKHNLQYAAIALGLVVLLIGFLVLSHSILANQKLIRFLGVVSLLIVFEFLNLLLHPYLGKVTHESPVWMLLIMVAIAAVLVPMHHRMEHWITHRLVEKNNRIRLAAPKRTISQLESINANELK